jgi:pyruvate,water dikinase
MTEGRTDRFHSPFELTTPAGAEGWERMYPYYYLFSEDRRHLDEGKFWFLESMYNPAPMDPFDAIMAEAWWVAQNAFATRVWRLPHGLGIDHRVLNGYLYVGPTLLTDRAVLAACADDFRRRAGHYYDHWTEIYEAWTTKARACIEELRAIQVRDLPAVEDERVVTERRGIASSYDLVAAYRSLVDNNTRMAYHHFELLTLGYVALYSFQELCRAAFPGIQDLTVARMVAGIDVLLLRPDDEVRALAKLAVELGIVDVFAEGAPPGDVLAALESTPEGRQWSEAFAKAREPWFWYCTGSGASHKNRAWNDDLSVPFGNLREYARKVGAGQSIDRPVDEVLAERERLTAEYRALLPTDSDRRAFDALGDLARMVVPFVENHNFFVEHWHRATLWNKMREFGRVFVRHGFLADAEDVFFMNRWEVEQALFELTAGWATGMPARGPAFWPGEIRARKAILDVLRRWAAPPALGTPPPAVKDPFIVMLWGVTHERIQNWLGRTHDETASTVVRGAGASAGVVEGAARVVETFEALASVCDGEILVCPIAAPSWAPVFTRVRAAVSDIGGIMSHAAVVAREYGVPAVVGTGFGTRVIKTGQRLRVNGNDGTVTILS